MTVLGARQHGDLLLGLSETGVEIPDDEWESFLEQLQYEAIKKILMLADGDAWIRVSVGQMRSGARLVRDLRDQKQRAAVVTTHRATRALVTAASWIGADVESFEDIGSAFEHLELSRGQRAIIRLGHNP